MNRAHLTVAQCDQLLERASICPANLPLTLSRAQLHSLIQSTFAQAKDFGVMQTSYKHSHPTKGAK